MITIKRARDERAVPRGQWGPAGGGPDGETALVRCPACGTGFVIARDLVGEVKCPNAECDFACPTAELEHFEGVEGGEA